VSGGVGESFLRDPVQHQFDLVPQLRKMRVEPVFDGEPCGGELTGESLKSADQAQFLKNAGAEPASDPSDLIEAAARSLLNLV
jgi:hypothetical protein